MARRLCSLSSICGFRFHKQQVHQATGGIVNNSHRKRLIRKMRVVV
ncbi:hypothetical protein ZJ38_003897 [Salmonella enterica subsp. enterica]|nr:hypothetical protein [Salmonella enterica subsp. enterica]